MVQKFKEIYIKKFTFVMIFNGMDNLIVDLGNTKLKLFVFSNGRIVYSVVETDYNDYLNLLEKCSEKFKCKNAIFSSVRSDGQKVLSLLLLKYSTIEVGPELSYPVEILYKTVGTLGHDRLAAVIGASVLYPNCNVLVIDAGTAITYDIVSSDKKYLGGTISPGISTRFRALHNFTEKLPLLSIDKDLNAMIGTTTEEAIILGVQNGILHEVDGVIKDFSKQFENLTVLFTGGDSFFFEKWIKNRIFAEPNLTAFGLNKILEINV
jgi:type III pantothenate kinase